MTSEQPRIEVKLNEVQKRDNIVGWIAVPSVSKRGVLKIRIQDPQYPQCMRDVGYVLAFQLKAVMEGRSQACPIQARKAWLK